MGGMRGSSHKRVPIALKLPQLQVRLHIFTTHFVDELSFVQIIDCDRYRAQQYLEYRSAERSVP